MSLKKYKIDKKIFESKCSIIYKTQDCKIIKIEKPGFNYLKNELKIRQFLAGNDDWILPIIDHGISKNERFIIYNYIENTICSQPMNIDKLHHLGYEMISIMEYIHKKGIVHCDISTKNILYDNNKFYLNDFGHAKHITFCIDENQGKSMVGCPLFCSEYIHAGIDYAPRDDFISFAYVLVYAINNSLPWSGKNNLNSIYQEKKKFSKNILHISSIPYEIKAFCNYCFHLKLNQQPNYAILKKLFTSSNKEISIHT